MLIDEPTDELDTESLRHDWEDRSAREQTHLDVSVSWAARTDIGRVRENNEDKFDVYLPESDDPLRRDRGRLWAIADGMGGHNAGQIASEAALKLLIRGYFSDSRTGLGITDALSSAIADANAVISRAAQESAGSKGMGTTLVAAVIQGDRLTVAHVGDSRAYLLRDSRLRPMTVDHSWIEEQVRRGSLTRADAEQSPYRNWITRSLGMGEGCEPDIVAERLQTGDMVLLATDGLTGMLDDSAIAERLRAGSVARIAMDLIDAANDAGGRDNVTVVVLRVRGIAPAAEVSA
jgi:protein phosphatase